MKDKNNVMIKKIIVNQTNTVVSWVDEALNQTTIKNTL
jgi:hypothetical protein